MGGVGFSNLTFLSTFQRLHWYIGENHRVEKSPNCAFVRIRAVFSWTKMRLLGPMTLFRDSIIGFGQLALDHTTSIPKIYNSWIFHFILYDLMGFRHDFLLSRLLYWIHFNFICHWQSQSNSKKNHRCNVSHFSVLDYTIFLSLNHSQCM